MKFQLEVSDTVGEIVRTEDLSAAKANALLLDAGPVYLQVTPDGVARANWTPDNDGNGEYSYSVAMAPVLHEEDLDLIRRCVACLTHPQAVWGTYKVEHIGSAAEALPVLQNLLERLSA